MAGKHAAHEGRVVKTMFSGLASRATVLKDISGLGALRAMGVLYPIVMLPILSRSLPENKFGVLLVFTSIAMWLAMLMSYGFDATATRDLVVARDDEEKSSVVSVVWSTQGVLVVIWAILLLITALCTPLLRDRPLMTLLAFVSAVAQAATPRWYFRATQRIARLALWEIVPRLASLPILTIALSAAPDPAVALALMLAAHLTTMLGATQSACRDLRRVRLSVRGVQQLLTRDFPVFLAFGASSIYTAANVVILSFFVTPAVAGFFGAAERMVRAVSSLVLVVPQALYPITVVIGRVNTRKARELVLVTATLVALLAAGAAAALWGLAPLIVSLLLGPRYVEVAELLRSLVWLLPLLGISNVVGVQGLLARGARWPYAATTVCSAILNVVLAVVMAPALGARGMIWSLLLSACVLCVTQTVVYAILLRRRATATPPFASAEAGAGP